MERANIGDVIICNGRKVIILKVVESFFWDGWYIEGYDQNNRYFYWKQPLDGGEFYPKKGESK